MYSYFKETFEEPWHMREQEMELPKCTPPSVKPVGQGGKGGDELAITVEVPFHFVLDACTTYAPAFVHPDSDIQCLLGMNVIPSLGTRVKRTNGEVMIEPAAPEPAAEAKVYLIQSTCIQCRKGTVLEAKFDLPVLRAMDSLLFEPDQEFLMSMGVSRCLTAKYQ